MFTGIIIQTGFFALQLLSRLPVAWWYLIADVIAFLLQHVFRYRRSVVQKNLYQSFPEKSKEELASITKEFYKNLSDRIVESILCIGIRKEEILKRAIVTNYNLVENLCAEGKNVVAVLGHCGSWEMACLSSSIYIDKYLKYAIYTPSRNADFDKKLKEVRGKFGMKLISMQETPKYLRQGLGETSVGMFLADQSHSNPKRAYWSVFLHQETAFMTGPARFAKAHQAAFVFVKVTQVHRGYYEIENILIEKDPTAFTENELTERFVRMLENQIRETPADWLWSHRRWKHKK
ncbi:MAG: lysophospholipid acyltransferase family protein [Bacteroidetes bacterium]|nr:lysophospholipid acyltransferase family protein [Bacteroidota bacterium]